MYLESEESLHSEHYSINVPGDLDDLAEMGIYEAFQN